MTKKAPARGRAIFRSCVAAYSRKNASAKRTEQNPIHQRRSSSRSVAMNRMYPKMLARTIAPIPAIAKRTVVDSLGTAGPPGAGGGTGSIVNQPVTGLPHSGQNFMFPGTSWPSGQRTTCDAPHSPQNLRPGGTGLPHLMQGLLPAATVVSAPQFPQNFTFTGFIVPHLGHALVCCWGPWAIMPPICDPIAYPIPMPAPRPTPVPAVPEGFAAAAFIESANANGWYAWALVRPRTFAEAIFSRASLMDSG